MRAIESVDARFVAIQKQMMTVAWSRTLPPRLKTTDRFHNAGST
jgi:hypothetical protein